MTYSIEQLYTVFQKHPIVSTDTRKLETGSIFFALSGPSFNGNAFASQAIEGGCSYAVIDDPTYQNGDQYLLVENSLEALQKLANHHRKQLKAQVIGITGSNGKTTTKELVRNVLAKKYKTLATQGNLNNHIGVPLTLLKLDSSIEMAIIEMGASKQGDIKELVEIAEPEFGLITNIGLAHLEGMGGPEGVIKTKTELYEFLKINSGLAFVNSHHAVFEEKSIGIRQFRFGAKDSDHVKGKFEGSNPFVSFRWTSTEDWNNLPIIETQLMGRYNYENILAAVAIGVYFDVNKQDINDAIRSYSPDNNRSQLIETGKNTLIMDAYNANPTSLEAALLNFAAMEKVNKVVIIGKMMELGPTTLEQHAKIGNLAVTSGFDQVFLIGENYQLSGVKGTTQLFANTEEAIEWFNQHPILDSTILIKGSRANQLEKLQPLF
jgi:UDP-N-acetylmuramoyl-tripeptide--D-alanyl-D-alanine ligase